jgi:hypothetical protein
MKLLAVKACQWPDAASGLNAGSRPVCAFTIQFRFSILHLSDFLRTTAAREEYAQVRAV